MQQHLPWTAENFSVEEAPDDRTTLERIRCQQLVKSMQLLMKGGIHIFKMPWSLIGDVRRSNQKDLKGLSKVYLLRIIILNVCVAERLECGY